MLLYLLEHTFFNWETMLFQCMGFFMKEANCPFLYIAVFKHG